MQTPQHSRVEALRDGMDLNNTSLRRRSMFNSSISTTSPESRIDVRKFFVFIKTIVDFDLLSFRSTMMKRREDYRDVLRQV
jgi:hypothetical protein